jgi:hypothetical protein
LAGLVPAIHDFVAAEQDVDARDKRGHDDERGAGSCFLHIASQLMYLDNASLTLRMQNARDTLGEFRCRSIRT